MVGTIVGWLPPEGEDIALWHVVHDDGDEEDLEESEVKDSLVENSENIEDAEDEGDSIQEAGLPDFQDCEPTEPVLLFRYTNTFPGGLGLRPHQVGFDGLRQELLRMEGRLAEGLKACGSPFQKEQRRDWENLVRQADSITQFRDSLLNLEDVVHATQEVPDKVDEIAAQDKRVTMKQEGWVFDVEVEGKCMLEELEKQYVELKGKEPETIAKRKAVREQTEEALVAEIESLKRGVSFIGRRGRRFFDNHGKSDGTIVAFLRGGLNEGMALWHMEHDDGDCEDLDVKDLEQVISYFENDAQEGEDNDEDDQNDESQAQGESDESDDGLSVEENNDRAESPTRDGVLWPTSTIRTRWRQALSQSLTVSEIALALSSFMDYCDRYGITRPDPLDASGTSLAIVSRRMWRDTVGGRESLGRNPIKTTSRTTRSMLSDNDDRGRTNERKGRDARRSSLKAVEGSRRMLRDRAAKKMVSYLE